MRKAIAGLLVVLTLAIGLPIAGAEPSAATLLGQLVDAGGRGSAGRSVELIRDGAVVATTVTTANGEFMFVGIAPGSYVVRTMVNNQAAGTRIAVNAGQSIPVTVVMPSLVTASPQIGLVFSGILQAGLFGGLAAGNQLFTNSQENNDIQFVQGINLIQFQQFFSDTFTGLNVDLGRFFRVGPYSTS